MGGATTLCYWMSPLRSVMKHRVVRKTDIENTLNSKDLHAPSEYETKQEVVVPSSSAIINQNQKHTDLQIAQVVEVRDTQRPEHAVQRRRDAAPDVEPGENVGHPVQVQHARRTVSARGSARAATDTRATSTPYLGTTQSLAKSSSCMNCRSSCQSASERR